MSILNTIADIGVGKTLENIGSLAKDIRQAITGELPPEKQAEIERQLNNLEAQTLEAETRVKEMQSNIIIAEAKGQSWLQRNWRPGLMTLFGLIVANNYIVVPYLSMFTDKVQVLEFPGAFWGLLVTGVGGYIGAKTVERVRNVRPEQKG
ncbi:MAG: 3TM-type holin [Desulfobacteraceae bacterium]